MFVYDKHKGRGRLSPCNHVVFYGQFLTKRAREKVPHSQGENVPVLVDVVRDTYLRKYLNLLEKDIDILEEVHAELKA